MSCREPQLAELLGPFALGACDDDEAARVRAHLPECADCRRRLEELEPVRLALLEAVPPVRPSPAVRATLMAQVREESDLFQAAAAPGAPPSAAPGPTRGRSPRNGRRWLDRARRPRALAVLAAALAALVVAGIAIGGGSGPAPRSIGFAVDRRLAPRGSAQLVVDGGRGRIEVAGLPAPAAGRRYQVWVARGSGRPRPTSALFDVDGRGDGAVDVPGSVADYDQVLVTDEPAEGSRTPTGAVVVRGRA